MTRGRQENRKPKNALRTRVNARLAPTSQTPLLSRPAPLCKCQSPRIGRAPKLACQFEGLVTFRTWRQQSGKLHGVRCEVVPIKPVRRALVFFAHRAAEFPLPG